MSGIGSRTRSRTPVDSEEAQDAPPAKSAKTTEVESDVESEVDAVAETPPKIGFRCADTKDPRHLCKSLGRALLDGATPSQGQIQALGHLLYECNENNVDVSGQIAKNAGEHLKRTSAAVTRVLRGEARNRVASEAVQVRDRERSEGNEANRILPTPQTFQIADEVSNSLSLSLPGRRSTPRRLSRSATCSSPPRIRSSTCPR